MVAIFENLSVLPQHLWKEGGRHPRVIMVIMAIMVIMVTIIIKVTIIIMVTILENLSVLPKHLRKQGGRHPRVATLAGTENLLVWRSSFTYIGN